MLRKLLLNLRVAASHIPLSWTLTLLLALGLLPAAMIGNFFVQQSLTDIEFAKQEDRGLQYLRTVWPAYTMATDAPTVALSMERSRAVRPALELAARDFDASLSSAKESDVVLRSLRDSEKTGYAGAPTGIGALLTRIGDQSNLILDPQLDTYYLVDVALTKLREVNDAVARVELARGKVEAPVEAAALRDAIKATRSSIERAIAGNSDGSLDRSGLRSRLKTMEAATEARLAVLTTDPHALSDGRAYSRARDQLWLETAGHLDRLIKKRMQTLSERLRTNIAISLVVAGLAIIWGTLMIRSLSQGLKRISQRLNALSEGDIDSPVPGIKLHNDVGIIARALQDFIARDGEREALAMQLNQAREDSRQALETTVERVNAENAELRQRENEQRAAAREAERRAIEALAHDLEGRVSGLLAVTRKAAGAMDNASGAMADIASQSFISAGDASNAAERIHETVDTLTPRVAHIAQSLRDLRERSDAGRKTASHAISRIDTASARMTAFASAADRIDAMQSMIATVAAQTNMLALNASIEAMRVGEAGHGFMVVANEVKALSTSTRQAAADIGEQISGMRNANGAVIEAFEAILSAMRELSQSALAISDGIAAQTDGIVEVEHAMHAANDTVARMTDGMVGASTAARKARDTSGNIADTCTQVVDQLASLDSTIADFTAGLKRAQAAR